MNNNENTSTATTQPHDENYIPSASEVQTPTGGKSAWRFSEGQIVTGRESDGTLRSTPSIVGRLRRIGIHSGVTRDTPPIPYIQLEAEFEQADGLCRVKAGVTDQKGNLQPSTPALNLAEGLLELALNELAIVTAAKSTKLNRFNKPTTYANLYHCDPTTLKGTQVRRRPIDKNKTMEDKWLELEAEIRLHPAYKERPRDENEITHYSELCKELTAKNWPTPDDAPAEWLQQMVAAFDERPTLASFNDDEWGEVRQLLATATLIPTLLQPAAILLGKMQAPKAKTGAFA